MKIGLTQTSLKNSADFANPYTLAAINAWLKRTDPEIETIYSIDIDELLSCDEVWCTSTSEAWGAVNKLGEKITKAGKKFVVGGHHATALPQTLLYGQAFRGEIETYHHLDEIPLPDWTIFNQSKQAVIITSRGCPYDCSFCSSRAFWQGYKEKSAEKVIEEIRLHVQSGAKQITIFDDLFIANQKRLQKVVELIHENGLDQIEYSCLVRSNLITPAIVELLKQMNVGHLAFGAESASDLVLKLMNKKSKAIEHQHAIDILNDYGIKPTISFIAGYPGETRNDLELTIEFIDRNRKKCDILEIYPCIPFPGTRLWNWFEKKFNIDVMHFDWESLSLNYGSTDWEKYHMLADYNKQDISEAIEWNKKSYQSEENPSNGSTSDLTGHKPVGLDPKTTLQSCRVCGSNHLEFIRELKSADNSGGTIPYLLCQECGTLLDACESHPDYSGATVFDVDAPLPAALKFYTEVGAGLSSLAVDIQVINSILSKQPDKKTSYLEVGSGFGYSVHMAKSLGWNAVGVEPGISGSYGRVLLDIPIHTEYLENTNLPEGGFQVISLSEVIEHISDPHQFLEIISKYLAPDGLLLLTTPNSEVLLGEEPFEKEWFECYSPGFHLNLFTPASLVWLLGQHGYQDVKFQLSGGSSGKKSILAVAAREPQSLPSIDVQLVYQESNRFLKAYLDKMIRERELSVKLDSVYYGAVYRLFEFYVNTGSYKDAVIGMDKIDRLLREKNLTEQDLENCSLNNFEDYLAKLPAFVAYYHFYKGIVHLNYTHDFDAARTCFQIAQKLFHLQKPMNFFNMVGWPENSRYHEGVSLLFAHKPWEALHIFNSLVSEFSRLNPSLQQSLLRSIGEANLQSGKHKLALYAFLKYIEFQVPGSNKEIIEYSYKSLEGIFQDYEEQLKKSNLAIKKISEQVATLSSTIAQLISQNKLTLPHSGTEPTHHLSGEDLLRAILESDDLVLSIMEYKDYLDAEFILAIQKAAGQAKENHETELFEGLLYLEEYVSKIIAEKNLQLN